jgi:hypothetical protein
VRSVLRERRRIRDRVIEQHAERRKADRAPQVRGDDEKRDDSGHRELRPYRDLTGLLDDGEAAWQVVVARHRQCGAPDARDQRKQ